MEPTEERGYAQVSQESINTWAEAVGISDMSPEMSRLLASDVTYRLRQALYSASQFLHASKRRRLTPDDFNRALRWMDVPPVLGCSGSVDGSVDWLAVPEVGVHVLADQAVNLASTALSGDIFHQPGNPCVKGEWAYVSGHVSVKGEGGGGEGVLTPLPLSPELHKYYQTLFSAICGHSNTVFQRLVEDLSVNSCIGPLVGAVVSGCLRGAQKARQNPCILRRLLLLVRALVANHNIHLGPLNYVRDIVSLVIFCVVTERKQSNDTQTIRSLATNILLKVMGGWSEGRHAWDVAVNSLGGVVASSTRPWSQHAGALTALLALGPAALKLSLLPCCRAYHARLEAALTPPPATAPAAAHRPHAAPPPASKDALDARMAQGLFMAGLVKIAASYVKSLPDFVEITVPYKQDPKTRSEQSTKKEKGTTATASSSSDSEKMDMESQDSTFMKLKEVYTMGESMFGSAFVLQVPGVYLCLHKSQMPSFMESHIYKEMQTTGEALLKDMLNREQLSDAGKSSRAHLGGPFQKKRKVNPPTYDLSSDMDFSGMDFASLIGDSPLRSYKKLPEEVFIYYKRILPRSRQIVPMNIQGCCVWEASRLKRPKGLLPEVKEHIHRPLLLKYYRSKPAINKMPHCRFTRPLQPKLKPGYSIHNIVL